MASERSTSDRVRGGMPSAPVAPSAAAPDAAPPRPATGAPPAVRSSTGRTAAKVPAAKVPAARKPTTKQVRPAVQPRRRSPAAGPPASGPPASGPPASGPPVVTGAAGRTGAWPARSEPAVSAGNDWTDSELVELAAELTADRAALTRKITEAERALVVAGELTGEGAGDDQADAGAKTFEREHEMSLAQNSKDLLSQVERALGRIQDRTYGACESCGRPIAKARLQAFPRATLCVSCKQREERR